MAGPVVLVGLMGSGKTTVGRRLANELDRPFVDADEAIEARAGRTVAELFATEGEARFRDVEAHVLAELLDRDDGPVVATGGGAVLRDESRALLAGRDDVLVVWLTGSPAFLASRVEQGAQRAARPLLAGDEPARAVLERLSAERDPLYEEVADLVVAVEPSAHADRAPGRIALDELADAVRRWSRGPRSVPS